MRHQWCRLKIESLKTFWRRHLSEGLLTQGPWLLRCKFALKIQSLLKIWQDTHIFKQRAVVKMGKVKGSNLSSTFNERYGMAINIWRIFLMTRKATYHPINKVEHCVNQWEYFSRKLVDPNTLVPSANLIPIHFLRRLTRNKVSYYLYLMKWVVGWRVKTCLKLTVAVCLNFVAYWCHFASFARKLSSVQWWFSTTVTRCENYCVTFYRILWRLLACRRQFLYIDDGNRMLVTTNIQQYWLIRYIIYHI